MNDAAKVDQKIGQDPIGVDCSSPVLPAVIRRDSIRIKELYCETERLSPVNHDFPTLTQNERICRMRWGKILMLWCLRREDAYPWYTEHLRKCPERKRLSQIAGENRSSWV